MTSTGFAPTAIAERYLQQLIKHWSHKMATSYADGVGQVPFSDTAHATLTAHADGVAITLTSPSAEDDQRLREVIEHHIDRFAFREAPLAYRWEHVA